MSLESFFGLDTDKPAGTESSEAFQEAMRESARAAAAIGAHQTAQKGKEDKLAKVLVRYMHDPAKSDVVFLVIKLLQENVPGAFILAVLSIADPEMELELRANFHEGKASESAIASFAGESFIPENIKIDLNLWGDAILTAGLMMPGKTLAGVLTPEQKLKSLVLDLLQFSLEEYFERHGMQFSEDKIRQVALLSIQGVLLRLRETSREKTDAEIIETPLGSPENAPVEEETQPVEQEK
ncbi:MAG: hypothetical protein WC846_02075 [Candidatus Gracilibacteria bacterium]|jgi:hypothetical protein